MINVKQIATPLLVVTLSATQLFAFDLGSAASMASSALNTQEKKAPATQASATDLTSSLVNSLGISKKQADGGVGSILSYAKGELPSNDYSKLASAIPNADSLVKMAPSTSKSSALGGLGSLASQGSSIAGMAGLASQFSSLGLDSGMISKFVPIIMDYFKSSGSTDAMGILGGLFK